MRLDLVWTVPGARAAREIAEEARARGVPVELADHATLDRLAGGGHHQGVAARARPFAYVPPADLLRAGASLLVALDGVTDPRNLGAVIRSAEALGTGGVILPRDRSAPVTPTVVRASAGATEHLPIAQVTNLARTLREAKDLGYWIVGLDPQGSSRFQGLPSIERALLVVGGEGRGVRPVVLRACDFLVRIPLWGRVASLNASVAAAIGLYELAAKVRGAAAQGGER
jgi:23S rRNA (guanosine2251-2'-O)-methyltransferase